VALCHRLRREHDHVVGKDNCDADDEAGETAIASMAGAERESQDAEDKARHRYRELLLDFDDLVVRREALSAELSRPSLQLGNG
jgi:hypothetical protein